jgi:drug/metabolite transporter (DMT)-like permease
VVVTLACGVIGVFLIGLGFSHKKRQERKMRYYSATIFVFVVGGLCLLVSLILFPLMFMFAQESHRREKDKWFFGWSYGVAWGAAIFLFGNAKNWSFFGHLDTVLQESILILMVYLFIFYKVRPCSWPVTVIVRRCFIAKGCI